MKKSRLKEGFFIVIKYQKGKAMYIRLVIILTNLVLFNYTIVNGIEQADSLLIENNINTNKTNLVSLNIFGPTCFTSISYSKFTSPQCNNEIGLGLVGFYGGIKYHRWMKIGWEKDIISPYTGLIYTHSVWPDTASDVLIFAAPTGGIYLPIGLHYIGSDGFSLAVELSRVWLFDSDISCFGERSFYWACLKIGYAF